MLKYIHHILLELTYVFLPTEGELLNRKHLKKAQRVRTLQVHYFGVHDLLEKQNQREQAKTYSSFLNE